MYFLENNSKTNLLEMKDWKIHFTNGTKGMPKTDPLILNYVESVLKKVYDNNEEKVNNNPIAPWIVKVVSELGGPVNINTEKINRIKTVIEYVKKTGNVANIPKMDLIQGSDFAKEKLNKIAEKEKHNINKPSEEKNKEIENKELSPEELALQYQEKSKKLFPELKDEASGKIERVWTCTDGSGRLWIKVIDNSWLSRYCESGDKWGIECQDTNFGNSKYVNYQLIGPPKGKTSPINTIVGMGILKSKGSIAEVKQEGNVQPGSQKTSGGWTDVDNMVIEFLTMAPEAKWINYFGDYYGNIELNPKRSLYGGGIGFLYHLSIEKPDLFKKLAEKRPDMIEANREIIEKIFPNIEELINFDLNEFAKNKPDVFLLNIQKYIEKFGQEARDILNSFDLLSISKKNPQLIENVIDVLVLNMPKDKFQQLIDNLDLSNYVWNNKLKSYSLIKNLSLLNDKTSINNLLNKYSKMFIGGFGGGVKGAISFLREMEKPKLPNHQNAIKDPEDGKYYAEREVNVKDENGNDKIDENGNVITKKVTFEIPDNLLILNQKERRNFISANEEFIKSSIKSDEQGKEITYLRLLFSQSNSQEIEKNMKKEKEKFISYYDSKFKVGEKKKIKVDNSDEILEQPYMLGEFELFSIINPKGIVSNGEKLYYPIGIENSKKNIVNIIKFYFDKNLLKEKEEITNRYGKKLSQEIAKKEIESKLFKIKYDSIKDYILTLIYSGEKEENAIKYFIDNFTPEKIKVPELYGYQMMFNIIKESFSDQIFYNVVKSFKEKILNMGEQGKSLYNQLLNKLNIGYYEVAAGNKVMYSNSNDMSYYEYNWNLNLNKETISGGPIFLTDGRLYEVIETGDYAGSKNGKVLILDEGYTTLKGEQINPKKRWFSSKLFKIKYKKTNNELNETLLRKKIQKRLMIVTENKKSINYTGIVLDKKSQQKLYDWVKEMIKNKKIPPISNWTYSGDHITINPGKSNDETLLDKDVDLKVLKYSFDDNVVAVSVIPVINDFEINFTKEIPHITIAYNEENKARPVMSNQLKNWKSVPKSFVLTGKIKEVPLI